MLAVGVVLAYQVLATAAQLVVTNRLGRYLEGYWIGMRVLFDEIETNFYSQEIRFGSNNDEIVKVAMERPLAICASLVLRDTLCRPRCGGGVPNVSDHVSRGICEGYQ